MPPKRRLAFYGSKCYTVSTMANAYKSKAFAALHESMADLHQAGAIETRTMREFDRACLTPVMKLSPAAIRRIRARAAVSQAVFAAHLNVTTGVVSKWERGEKQPRGPAAKLLTLAAKHGIAAIA
jgi:putative transcriptional regulator